MFGPSPLLLKESSLSYGDPVTCILVALPVFCHFETAHPVPKLAGRDSWRILCSPARDSHISSQIRSMLRVLCCLQAFDDLLLLQRGGSTLYCGPLGEGCKNLIGYFQKLGADDMSPGYNPATWMLENTTASVEEKKDVSFAQAFQDSDLKR